MREKQRAFLFDMNGTMIDDMEFHCQVWHNLLNGDLSAGMTYQEVKMHMYGKNSELLKRIFGPDKFTEDELDVWSYEKERRYQEVYLPHLKLLPGLDNFLKKASELEIPMAIGSAAIMFNVNFVLDNLNIRHYFRGIVSADDVAVSKPHPETFLKAAECMQVDPKNCIVFEDAPKGVETAQNAGMKAVVVLTAHGPEEFAQYGNVLGMIKDYNDPLLEKFLRSR